MEVGGVCGIGPQACVRGGVSERGEGGFGWMEGWLEGPQEEDWWSLGAVDWEGFESSLEGVSAEGVVCK